MPPTASEIFEKHFSFYLAIGMSAEDYWNGDPALVLHYRKAYKIRQEEIDYQSWLNGLYISRAIGSMTPLPVSFVDTRRYKPVAYPERPYVIEQRAKQDKTKQDEERAGCIEWMKMFAERWNAKIRSQKNEHNS